MKIFNIFKSGGSNTKYTQIPIYLFNTLYGQKQEFKPLIEGKVKMYNCGPTVYERPHIGNLRAFVFADVLRRMFEYNGYKVRQVINITDVGHLTSDGDDGEDKVEEKAKQEGRKVLDVVQDATDSFFNDLHALNAIHKDTLFPKASKYIKEQIVFIKTLEEKGYTYKIDDGIYFDTSKFRNYGKLGKINIEGLKEGARVKKNIQKHNLTDFALWKFSKKDEKRQQEWESPWGVGFPGWHLECSALSMKHLGKQLDVHTGGVDHIPIHHNNEITQTESVTGTRFVNYWMHVDFITIDGKKISKSLGNTILLKNISDRDIPPLAYRYWLLSAHYQSKMNFTWETLEGARTALFKLHRYFVEQLGTKKGDVSTRYQNKFHLFINDNLDTPRATALLFDLMKDEKIPKEDKRATFLDFDKVLGIGFTQSNKRLLESLSDKHKIKVKQIPDDIQKLINEREQARKEKNWDRSDKIREKIKEKGYDLDDTKEGTKITKIS